MTMHPIEEIPGQETTADKSDRRSFIKNASAAGLVMGAKGITRALTESAEAAQKPGGTDDPPRPAGIRPGGAFDCRFPIAYETSVPEATKVLMQYFASLSRRDLKGIAQTLHFPYGTYEGLEATIVESSESLMDAPPPSMNVTGTGVNLIKPGSYDMMDSLEVHNFLPVNVQFSLCYSRYAANGEKILVCQGIYAITNNDGKWGIQLASTIFKPADEADLIFKDAEQAYLRQERTDALAFANRDISRLRTLIMNPGKQAIIAEPLDWKSPLVAAHAGDPMAPYKTKGVKTRLKVRDVPETRSEIDAAKMGTVFNDYYEIARGGFPKYAATRIAPYARVLHSSSDKAHVWGGYIRNAPDLTLINEFHRGLGVFTYVNGHWGYAGTAGGLGDVYYHDYWNDDRC
jgi:hypothetical protein